MLVISTGAPNLYTTATCPPIPVETLNAGNGTITIDCPDMALNKMPIGYYNLEMVFTKNWVAATWFSVLDHITTTYYTLKSTAATQPIGTATAKTTTRSTYTYTAPVQPASIVGIVTGTSTCFVTVTATPPASSSSLPKRIIQQKHHAEDTADRLEKRAGTIGVPDFTYPPFPSKTVTVRSMTTITTTSTVWIPVTYYPPNSGTSTQYIEAYTFINITVPYSKPTTTA
jgi:hypothetical protein